MDNYERGKLSDSLKTMTFNKGDYIITEGEKGDVFYILERGKAIATKTVEPGNQ